MDLLARIQRLVWNGRIAYTRKATQEMALDGLDEVDVESSILRANAVRSKRSRSPDRAHPGEMLHVIEGASLDGVLVYTKGVIRKQGGAEVFYVLVSAKRSTRGR